MTSGVYKRKPEELLRLKKFMVKLGNEYGSKHGKLYGKFNTPFKVGIRRLGEKAGGWKGGKTKLSQLIRRSFNYRQWRSDIFTRDLFTCQLCNKKGGYLEADHFPKEFYKILDEYKIKSILEADECEELWNINNGRTLCRECHKKTDNWGVKSRWLNHLKGKIQ